MKLHSVRNVYGWTKTFEKVEIDRVKIKINQITNKKYKILNSNNLIYYFIK